LCWYIGSAEYQYFIRVGIIGVEVEQVLESIEVGTMAFQSFEGYAKGGADFGAVSVVIAEIRFDFVLIEHNGDLTKQERLG
jgi:hypothetical protein